MGWADEIRTLRVCTNADTPRDAEQAVRFGAEGIGLCRTEHMFFEADRIKAMREMIVSEQTKPSAARLWKNCCPCSSSDFEGLFMAMGGRPVTIRFLDPPLHEFLPQEEEDIIEIAGEMNMNGGRAEASDRRPPRVQPHAGPSRLPSGRHLSGDRRDADHAL